MAQRFLTLVFVVSLAAYFVSPASAAANRYRSYGHYNHRHGMFIYRGNPDEGHFPVSHRCARSGRC
jgi:hypothetical protein